MVLIIKLPNQSVSVALFILKTDLEYTEPHKLIWNYTKNERVFLKFTQNLKE